MIILNRNLTASFKVLISDVITDAVVRVKLITAVKEGIKVGTAGDRDDRGDDVVDEHLLSCPRVWPSPATGGVVICCSRRLRVSFIRI